jgi:hypothetical protein
MAIITATAPLPQTPSPQKEQARQNPITEGEPEVPKQDPLSPQFAALARQQKALRAESMRAKAEREAWMAEKAKYETDYIPKSNLKQAALEALRKGEIPYDEVAQEMLREDVNPELARLQAEIAELKAGQDKFKTQAEERQSAEYKAALKQITTDVTEMIAQGDDFELIREMGQTEAVVELIEDTFKEEGRIMSNEEAAKQVEEYLLEEALKVAQMNKIKQRLTPAQESQQKSATPQKLQTLSNAVGTTKPMSARERAILAFKGELK